MKRYVKQYTDEDMERLWIEFEDVTTVENDYGQLVINSKWKQFPAGTEVEDIWEWFDNHYSKGVGYLMEEFVY